MSNDASMKENQEGHGDDDNAKSSAAAAGEVPLQKERNATTSTTSTSDDTVDTEATERKDNTTTASASAASADATKKANGSNASTATTTATSGSGDDKNKNDNDKQNKMTTTTTTKKKVTDWPRTNIPEPHAHDVLYGRGGGTNHHPGNKRYRKMVEDRKVDYVNSKRLDKPLVALDIIRAWRAQDPPGRFLKIDEKTGLWNDVGDKKAREKTSQALREKAPQIRQQQHEEQMAKERGETGGSDDGDGNDGDGGRRRSTTFADGTKAGNDGSRRPAAICRDTSLGREFINPGESLAVDASIFESGRQNSTNMGGGGTTTDQQFPQQRVPSGGAYYGHAPPPGVAAPYRYDSRGPPPQRYMSGGGPPPPGTDDPHARYASQGRYESWGGLDTPLPPPQPGYFVQSGQSHGSWGPAPSAREHSLGPVALPHASVSHPAPYNAFDAARNPSGQFQQHHPHHRHQPPYPPQSGRPPPPGPPSYGPPSFQYSNGPHSPQPHHRQPPPPHGPPPQYNSGGPPTSYSFDPSVASAWSGQGPGEVVRTMSGEEYDRQRNGAVAHPPRSPKSPKNHSSVPQGSRPTTAPLIGAKPDTIKRATSNQNETPETRPCMAGPSIKKAALNRDNSCAANRLKELSFPDQFSNGKFDVAKEVNVLNQEMAQSSLSALPPADGVQSTKKSMPPPSGAAAGNRTSSQGSLPSINDSDVPTVPRPASPNERSSTLDRIAASELSVIKPEALSGDVRATTTNTIDELGQFDLLNDDLDDPLIAERPGPMTERMTTEDIVMADLLGESGRRGGGPSRPPALGAADRITTTDILEIVNEPIVEDV